MATTHELSIVDRPRYEATVAQAEACQIRSAAERQLAADLWDALRAFRKQAEARKEQVCRPLKAAWEAAKRPFDDFIKECSHYEARIQQRMSAWDAEQARRAAEEQAKLQAKIDAENARRLAKAVETGREPVLKPVPVVPPPARTLTTQAGTQQVRAERIVYRLKGIEPGERLTADDPRVQELVKLAPSLFVLDWQAFKRAAESGMLDRCALVERTTEYIYQQRKGGSHAGL